jgi:poly(beta-D-mannuronate) lyase
VVDVTKVTRFALVSALACVGGTALPASAASAPMPSITKISAADSTVDGGDRATFKVTVRNAASRPSGRSPIVLRLSRTGTGNDGRTIVSGKLPAVGADTQKTFPVGARIPANLPSAKYYVLVCRSRGGKLSCPERTSVKVSGPPAVLTFEPRTAAFGSVASGESSPTRRFVVRNVGQSPSGEIEFDLNGDDDQFKLVSNNCGNGSLWPGRSCNVYASFRPKRGGEFEAELQADPDNGRSSSMPMTGIGRGDDENDGTDESGGDNVPPPCGTNPGNRPAPGTVLNLTNWKLTLPTDGCDSDSWADEVTHPQLSTFKDAVAFYTNSAKTGVVFHARVDGARTSSNTKYPRSELREMKANGEDRAEWSNASGKGTHVMSMDAAITKTPATKPEVVAAQIHDASDDVIMIRLYGKRLVVDAEDSKVQLPLDENYVLGTRFAVTITAAGGKIRVNYNNGARVVDYQRSGSGMYFKAGCYTLSNTTYDSPSEYGEVVIYRLAVSHS